MPEKNDVLLTHPSWHIDVSFVRDSNTSMHYQDEGIGERDFNHSINRLTHEISSFCQSEIKGEKV